MAGRAPDDRLEGPGVLCPERVSVVAHGAAGELDAVPHEQVRRDELIERLERTTAQLDLRRRFQDLPDELAGGANIGVGEPGHGSESDDTPRYAPLPESGE